MLSTLLTVLAACSAAFAQTPPKQGSSGQWPAYGGDPGGQRYASAAQIKVSNVGALQPAWTFHTHVFDTPSPLNSAASFEATPVLWNRTLYFDGPFNEIFALDAATGKLKWSFDPKVDRSKPLFMLTSRGVALWHAEDPSPGTCGSERVLMATVDRRLIARDAVTGEACPGFGVGGTVDLSQGVEIAMPQFYYFSSPPVTVGNVIVLGSSIGDNQAVFVASGAVRGFDAISGRQIWSWEPVRWTANQHPRLSGSGNAWAPLAADAEHDLVFVPTGSPSVDLYGGLRVGDNRDADSIVALRASTGQRVWAFQLVHHDLWDYDTASQPLLFTFRGHTPAVAVTNKTGMIYVFNRITGEPLYPIEERPVLQSNIAGEVTWKTQPFSSLPPLLPLNYLPSSLGGDAEDRSYCAAAISKLRYEGLFTPPSLQPAYYYPSGWGGPNWGSSAFDPRTGILYTRLSSVGLELHLTPRLTSAEALWQRVQRKWDRTFFAPENGSVTHPLIEVGRAFRPPDLGVGTRDDSLMVGAPYGMHVEAVLSPRGLPCAPAPFGRLVATNLDTGRQLWSVPNGEVISGVKGSMGVGGSIVTAGGLVFVASTNDPYLHAYDAASGQELWKGRLPASANATPMSYVIGHRQYIVIAVGGKKVLPEGQSDTVVAFALPLAKP